MIPLGTSVEIAGVSTNATTVNYTIGGLLMNSASPPVATGYQILAQGQLPSSVGSIYNPGGSATALISYVNLNNTGATQQNVTLYLWGTATANITEQLTIPANGWAEYSEGNGWSIFTASGLLVTAAPSFQSAPFTGTQATCVATTHPVSAMGTATEAALTSGTVSLYPVQIPVGTNIGHLVFVSGTTAASTPTHWWFCLTDASRNLLAITADQTTATWTASTLKSLAIATTSLGAATSWTTVYSGTHYIGIMVTASTVPTLFGSTPASTTLLTQSTMGGGKSSTTGQTTPSAFPTQYGAITNQAFNVYGECA